MRPKTALQARACRPALRCKHACLAAEHPTQPTNSSALDTHKPLPSFPGSFAASRYIAPAGAEGATKGTTLRSLRHAFGPQIGTLCYAGAVTVVAQYVTALADR